MQKPSILLNISFVLCLFILASMGAYAQSDNILKEVYGTVTYKNVPLKDVNIQVKFTQRGTKTEADGTYRIKVSEGEVLEFTFVGMQPMSIVIEDVTQRLDIGMFEMENVLDETVITATKKSSKSIQPEMRELKLSIGTYRLEELGSVAYLDKTRVAMNTLSLESLLKPYFFGKQGRIIFEIDGAPFVYPPTIALGIIEEIYIVSDVSMARYGYYGRGNIVIIRTIDALRREEMAARKLTDLRSNTFYKNNAVNYRDNWSKHASFFNVLSKVGSAAVAFRQYSSQQNKSFDFHLDAANFFSKTFPETSHAQQILHQLASAYHKQPEVLKAIAYYFDRLGELTAAGALYRTLMELRPTYAQSYRDLANSYREQAAYTRAWRTYMYGMLKEEVNVSSGVGAMVYNEMEWLYFRKSEETDIKERFLPRTSMMTPFENDVRLVFEWNTSEAEFELEFVNPEGRSYAFNHTLKDNEALITDEKLRGYSSKEFLQEQLTEGEWAVYISYYGNKKQAPTFLKMTRYYNWGKANEHKVVEVFRLEGNLPKVQLSSLHRNQLIVTN